jgi:thiol-disulfide isomerase/thioredoxin
MTADDFQDVLEDEGVDLLLEFYAPWCGICLQLAPLYAQVGRACALERSR